MASRSENRRLSVGVLAAVLMTGVWATVVVARTASSQDPQRPVEGIILPPHQTAKPAPTPTPGAQPPQAPQPPAPTTPQPPPQGGYIGEAACLECHDEQRKGYADSMHGRASHPRAPAANQGCESCHGPGAKHAEEPDVAGSIRAFPKIPPREASETCLTCHARDQHAMWESSSHDARNLSCVTCHSIHAFKSERAQLKTRDELGTCATCHRDKIAKLDRSGHMPVREGKMQCSTCHNPHGSPNVRMLRRGDSIAETCTSCHADKRGPFLWEHAPTRDGCVTCHDPHGSSNERMLVAKTPILCQRCHVMTRHPSTIYDGALIGSGATPSVRIYARSCVTCHSAIHGSNHPSGQRFIR
jgi:DmsE family decaheme c-type cytochrome